jgi:hypothetical protein
MLSLLELLRKAPDPRGKNTRLRIGPVLAIIAMALLAGRRDIAEIERFAQSLSQAQRRQLCLPRKKGTKAFWQVPSYSVFYQVLTRMDPEPFAALLDGWLQAQAGALPQALALDGKMIRDHIGLLTLAQHEDGAPQSVAVYDQKENRDVFVGLDVGTPQRGKAARASKDVLLPTIGPGPRVKSWLPTDDFHPAARNLHSKHKARPAHGLAILAVPRVQRAGLLHDLVPHGAAEAPTEHRCVVHGFG